MKGAADAVNRRQRSEEHAPAIRGNDLLLFVDGLAAAGARGLRNGLLDRAR